MKRFFVSTWDWAKRLFGRSKIVFTNVVGILVAGWVELYDPISMFDWNSVTDKHEVAIGIGIGIQVLNTLFRIYASNGPVNFGRLPDPEPFVIDENAEQLSPKAE